MFRRERYYNLHRDECDLAPDSRFQRIVRGNSVPATPRENRSPIKLENLTTLRPVMEDDERVVSFKKFLVNF